MKHFTSATITVALSLAVVACGSGDKSSPSTSTSTSTSKSTSTTTTASTSATPGARKTIADYIKENNITETPVRRGDPGSPTINLPMPPGWAVTDDNSASYGTIALTQAANPADPPKISALVSKLTGEVDQAKLIQYAPGEVQNLPGARVAGDGSASTLSGFQAWQISGTYARGGKTRAIAQKTVVIPGQGAVFVLQLNADSLASDQGPLLDAMNVVDEQTTINP